MKNKLIIIGNGFDLHLHVKSSFSDFLFSSISNNKSHILPVEDIENHYNQMITISKISKPNNQKEYLKKINLYITKNLFPEYFHKNKDNVIIDRIKIDPSNNFWCKYFKYLSKFPNYNNKNDRITTDERNNITLKNWSDVEYQIQYLLENSMDIFQHITKMRNHDVRLYSENPDSITLELFNILKTDEIIAFSDVINFNALFLSIQTGWDYVNQSIYDFLFTELIEFENLFKQYLNEEISTKPNYQKNAYELLMKIAETDNINLINFNYTIFYDTNDKRKTNIHSTLSNDNHPIFGISSVGFDDKSNYYKPFYKFTKAFRIMSITDVNSSKDTLPDDVEEIIFYGHSLSKMDYMYLETILKKYLNDDNDKKIVFTFKYSKYSDEAEQKQIQSIFNLFKIFYSSNGSTKGIQDLLLANRIKIQEI